jgi:uncharacterized Zn finger protein
MSYFDRIDKQYKPKQTGPIELECENCGTTKNAVHRRIPFHGGDEAVLCVTCYYTVGVSP